MPATSLNLELLIKLLKLTTSTIDGEALSAMRKANDQLRKVGGDWGALLRGKVTLVADPFSSVQAPPKRDDYHRAASAPPKPQPAQPFAPPPRAAAPPPPPPPPQPPPRATRRNSFSGHCYACGVYVDQNHGFIFQFPGKTRWEVLCNYHATTTAPLPGRRAKIQPASTSQIFNTL